MTAMRTRVVRMIALLALFAACLPAARSQEAPAVEAGAEPPPQPDPCVDAAGAESARLDRFRAGVTRRVCASSRWFDGLFGDSRLHAASYQEAYGRLGTGLGWDELDGATLDAHLRAYFPLPTMSDRMRAVIGRDSEEHFVTDDFDEAYFLATSFSDDRDANWYAGLSYDAARGAHSRFDVSAGVRVDSPPNPYLKGRYTYATYPGRNVLLTTRATAFWENHDGLGLTLAGDTDWAVSGSWLLRWANTLRFSESTAGLLWKTRVGLYQVLSPHSAMRYDASVRGETDGLQPDLYGLRVTHRRSVWRDWLFLELSGSLFWADSTDPALRCDACVGVAAGFEILFGDHYDRLLERGRERQAPAMPDAER